MFGPGQTGGYAALTLISVLWGSYPAFAKLALVAFPPLALVALRCSIASIFLGALLLRRGWSEFTALRLRDLGPLASVFTTPSIVTVLHAGDNDLVQLKRRGFAFSGLFDTLRLE